MLSRADYGRVLEPMLRQAAGYARSILRNRMDAEDAVQQAVLRGLERLESYDPARPFKGWWFTVLRNCCMDLLNDRRQNPQYYPSQDETQLEHLVASEPDWSALDRAFEVLTSKHQEIIRLRYFADLSYAEISEALAIPVGTVMSRLHHARLALAEQLQENAT